MMIVEVEYYKGDVLLYGSKIRRNELNKQLIEVENTYDKVQNNFIDPVLQKIWLDNFG